MAFFLSPRASLKWLETPSVYHVVRDELYELDDESFAFLRSCAAPGGCSGSNEQFTAYCLAEDLLTETASLHPRPPVAPAPCPSLRYLELQLVERCNLRCRHCYISGQEEGELPPEDVRGVLRELEALQGLRVLLTGGEPLLHSRFAEINAMLPDHALHTVLFTNGLLLTPAVLAGLNAHEIQISIDGMEAAHDVLRGPGAWKKAVRALRLAIDAGFPVSVATMVHRANLGDFDAMDALFRSLGVREWSVDVPCSAGRWTANGDLSVTPREGGRFLAYGYGGGMHGSAAGYACGLHLMAVRPDGNAAKCTFYGDRPAGNIREGLRLCWERIKPIPLRSLECSCDVLDACRGGCRYRAEQTGGPGSCDPYRCSLHGIVDKTE